MKAIYKRPNKKVFYDLELEEHDKKAIVLYFDAKEHMKRRHLKHFKTEANYYNAVDHIQDILSYPDFTYYDESKNGLLMYSKIDENVCLVIEISLADELKIKTMYPLSEKSYSKKKMQSLIQKSDIELQRMINKYSYKNKIETDKVKQ